MLNKSQNCEAGWFWFPRWTVVCKKKVRVLKWNQAKHAYSLLCSSHTSMCNNDIVSWMIMLHWVISSLPNTELLSFTLILMLGDKRCYDYTYFLECLCMTEIVNVENLGYGTGDRQNLPKFELWTLDFTLTCLIHANGETPVGSGRWGYTSVKLLGGPVEPQRR